MALCKRTQFAPRPQVLCALGLLAVLTSCQRDHSTTAFPRKPIKIVVYTGAGGPIDYTMRKFAEIAQRHSSATFYIENKPGAGGIVAMEHVLQSPADGYTLCACTKSNISKAVLEGREGYLEAFDWIAKLMDDPECVITRSDSPLADWSTFVANDPPSVESQVWLGPAPGGLDHVTAMQIWEHFGIKARWLHHKSGGDALTALLGGQGVAYVGNPSEAAGNPELTVAVVSSPRRLPQWPNAPTFSELGAPELDNQSMWRGVALKRGCPPLVRQWYDDLFQKIDQDPEWRALWEKDGIEVAYQPENEFSQIVARDQAEARKYLSQLGMLSEQRTHSPSWLRWVQGRGMVILSIAYCLGGGWITYRGNWQTAGPRFVTAIVASVALLFLLQTFAFRSTEHLSAATVPRIWILSILGLAALVWWDDRRQRKMSSRDVEQRCDESHSVRTARFRRVTWTWLLVVTYVIALPFLGYLLSTFLFLILTGGLLGERRLGRLLLVSSVWVAAAYLVFIRLLHVPLPWGRIFE